MGTAMMPNEIDKGRVSRLLFALPAMFALSVLCGCHPQAQREYPARIACEGITLILVPQGTRMIGTNNSRAEPWERPASLYEMDKVLYMGQTEVTAGQIRRLFSSWPYTTPANEAACVPWEMAKRFCDRFEERLESQTGRNWRVRLPTEAEWEYAARYGRPPGEDWWPEAWDEKWHGPNALMDHEWFARNSDDHAHPVAQKKPNPLGLYDMLGNASEWCEGWLTDSVTTMLEQDGNSARHWPPGCNFYGKNAGHWVHPARGGTCLSSADDCRPSRRRPRSTCSFRIVALPEDEP